MTLNLQLREREQERQESEKLRQEFAQHVSSSNVLRAQC